MHVKLVNKRGKQHQPATRLSEMSEIEVRKKRNKKQQQKRHGTCRNSGRKKKLVKKRKILHTQSSKTD